MNIHAANGGGGGRDQTVRHGNTVFSNCDFGINMAEAVGGALGSGATVAKAIFDDRGLVAGLLPV